MAHHFNTNGVFGISKFDTSKLACNCIVNKLIAIMTKTLLFYEPGREKTVFCICKNKDADQLQGNREADQCLSFRYMDSTISLPSKHKVSSP